jgi:hypothetical protein
MKSSKKTRDFLIRFGLSFFSIILSILIIEIVLRVGFKDKILLFPRYQTDAQYGEFTLRKIRPNFVFWHTSIDGSWKFTTNKQGFRNYGDFDYRKPEGVIRIVSLGDSQTQGYEVRQEFTYSAVIEKYLTQKGYQAEVMNTGVSGFGTAEELVLLENEIVNYQPDFVVLGFYKNDFEDNIRSNLFELDQNDNLLIKNKEYIPGVKIQNLIYSLPFTKWLGENSYAYSYIFNGVWEYYKNKSKSNAKDLVTEYATPKQLAISDYQILYTSKLIERMYQFCRDHHIKLIILDIPSILGVNESQQYVSSIPPTMLATIENNSDAIIKSDDILSDYQGVTDIFLQHGARHISEFTHTLLGVAVSKNIWRLIR